MSLGEKKQKTKKNFAMQWEKNTPKLCGPPQQQQPRLILFVEVPVVKWSLVVKRDSLEMRWRPPLGA